MKAFRIYLRLVTWSAVVALSLPSVADQEVEDSTVSNGKRPLGLNSMQPTLETRVANTDKELESLQILYRSAAGKYPEEWCEAKRAQINSIFRQYLRANMLAASDLRSPRCSDDWAAKMLYPFGDGDNRIIVPATSVALQNAFTLREKLIRLTDRKAVKEAEENIVEAKKKTRLPSKSDCSDRL
jgi:hypothetical protein